MCQWPCLPPPVWCQPMCSLVDQTSAQHHGFPQQSYAFQVWTKYHNRGVEIRTVGIHRALAALQSESNIPQSTLGCVLKYGHTRHLAGKCNWSWLIHSSQVSFHLEVSCSNTQNRCGILAEWCREIFTNIDTAQDTKTRSMLNCVKLKPKSNQNPIKLTIDYSSYHFCSFWISCAFWNWGFFSQPVIYFATFNASNWFL